CKECNKEYHKEHYRLHKGTYVKKLADRRVGIGKFISELRKDLKCSLCGENHPATLDFHHSNPKDKDFTISEACKGGFSIEKIKEEIAKCIVLCSNCHRKEHWKQRPMRLR